MKTFFRRNLGLKIISGLVALIVWAFIVGRSPEVRWMDVPIEFQESQNRVVTSSSTETVQVRLEGEAVVLSGLREGDPRAAIAIDHLPPGSHAIGVVPEEIRNLPRSVTVTDVRSAGLTIRVDARSTVLVPVLIVRSTEAPPGFRVESQSVQPTDVEISGPLAQIREIGEVPTESFDLTSESGSFTRLVKLVPPGEHVRVAPSSVRLTVELEELAVGHSFTLPVTPSAGGWRTEPREVVVTIEAPPSLVESLLGELSAIARVDELNGAAEVVVTLDWGDLDPEILGRVRELSIEPQRVRAIPVTVPQGP